MTVLRVPFHQDTRLPDTDAPLPARVDSRLVDPVLPAGTEQWPRLVALEDAVAEAVREALTGPGPDRGSFAGPDAGPEAAAAAVTVVSGDCLVALGTLAGAQRAGLDPGIVWFDAHGDVHTMASSTSGYLGGMVLRWAVGGDPERVAGPIGLRPLAEDRAVLVDARDLDPGEVDYLATAGIHRAGVEQVDAALLSSAVPDGPLVLHVDLDVVDSGELTGLLFPAPDGPGTSAVLAAIGRVLATGRVAVLDLACPWHPATSAREAEARAKVIADVLAMASPAIA